MKGPYDGQNLTYRFGRIPGRTRDFETQATTLAKAIRAFRVGALFPHQYSTTRVTTWQVGKDGWEEAVYLASEPGGHIPVHVLLKTGLTEVAQIPPEAEDLDAEFGSALLAAQVHLQIGAETMGLGETTTALAPASAATGLQSTRRHELEARTLALQQKMGELALAKRELENQVALMQAEVARRMEQIWMIELFLGSNEEVKRLAEGKPAPESEPITVRQLVLCMDEELAVYDWFHNPDRIGEFDYHDLDDFDRWLVSDPEHLAAIFPHQKGIVGLRVRRKAKNRDDAYADMGIAGAFLKMQEEQLDSMTYLLVRNGENLYRLWVDVQLFPRLFAAEKDFAPLHDLASVQPGRETLAAKMNQRDFEAKMKRYFAGLLVVQGLLERSDLFHPLPAPGISVFKPEDQKYFNLVRDGEENLMLADTSNPLAHLSWKSYRKWIGEQLAVGTRVLWMGRVDQGWSDRKNPLLERTGMASIASWPARSEVYTITEHRERTWSGANWVFLYLPNDVVVKPDLEYYGSTVEPRKRRVSFSAYSDEVLPVDFMSWRVIEHLLRDRNSRVDYGNFFVPAFNWWKSRKAELEREKPFVDLVLTQAGVDLGNEGERARAERLVRWWKMKTQEHRTLATDESKALRMVLQAFVRGDDHENDPERLLFTSR